MTQPLQTSAPEENYHPGIPVALIYPSPSNPRKHIDNAAQEELRQSVLKHGVIQPIVVRPHPTKPYNYEIVVGERRWRAARGAGLHSIKAIERKLDDGAVLELQIIENLQRQDVHELEEAEGFRQLMTARGLTAEDVAKRVSKSTKYVWDRVKLCSLIPELQAMFLERKFTAGHAILLARLTDQQQAAWIKTWTEMALPIPSVRGLAKVLQTPKQLDSGDKRRTPKQPAMDAVIDSVRDFLPDDEEDPATPVAPNPLGADFRRMADAMIVEAELGNKEAREAIKLIISEMGRKGGFARAKSMTAKQRRESATKASHARFTKTKRRKR